MFKFIKNILPQSLLPRLILIIIIPALAAHLITAYIFYQRHLSTVNNNLSNNLADSIAAIVKVYELNHDTRSQIITQLSSSLRLFLSIDDKNGNLSLQHATHLTSELKSLKTKIEDRINLQVNVSYLNKNTEILIEIKSQDFLLKFITKRKRIYITTTHIFIMWLIGAAILFATLSIIFVKNQVTPLKRLSKAVELFGKGQSTGILKFGGAKEVRKAAIAFTKMKSRIEKYISYRTEILAGVSHDLRTPITRVKLQLAMMEQSDDVHAIKEDLSEMEDMIQKYLDFAKGEDNEISVKVFFNEYFLSIIKTYNRYTHSINFNFSNTDKLQIDLKLTSFKRALTNIIDNSIKYASYINIKTIKSVEGMQIIIEDNGPGIKKELYKEAFKPFSRLNSTHTINKTGSGLGLAIARDIISNHGGEISLDQSSELKGLKVTINLPY